MWPIFKSGYALVAGAVASLDAGGQPNPDEVINVGDALVILGKALQIIVF
ncbi:MAG: hypothetical protein U9R17_01330 [Thermodesulfobacteriota bacterium]|nr:hypothetical protein [Thermodesulfobacteriota bacterium]